MAAARKTDWVGLGQGGAAAQGWRGLPRAGLQREPGELRSRRGHAAKVGSSATEQEPRSEAEPTRKPRSEAEPTRKPLGRAWGLGEEPKSRLLHATG